MHIVCYLRQSSKVFETYWTTSRGVEVMDNNYHLLDLTVYGRQEQWEDSPPGWPQQCTYTRTSSGSPTWQPAWPGGRPIAQWPRVLAMLSVNVIRCVVRRVAERIQLVHLAPHDLRRTCAKLCHVNGGELEQIQFLLGHVSVLTTDRKLGCKQNLEEPVNDRFGCLFSRTSVELR